MVTIEMIKKLKGIVKQEENGNLKTAYQELFNDWLYLFGKVKIYGN